MPTIMNFTSTYDPTTMIGQVRMAIQDLDVDTTPPEDPSSTPRDQWSCLFVDQEIQIRLNAYSDKVNAVDLAAADLLEDMASSSAILARLITFGDYTSDTRQTAKTLRDQADWLRSRYAKAQSAGSEEPAEAITPEVWDDFDLRRWLWTRG